MEPNFKTYEFTKLALHAQHRLPLGMASTLKANQHIDYASEHLVLTLKAYVASDGPRLKVISYPATWQDAVLARFIPLKWQWRFSRLRPTYRHYEFTTNYVYPNLELPNDSRYMRVVIGDSRSWLDELESGK
jgi:hypothetical protein